MITIKNLDFSYSGKPPYLLENINLDIKKGEYVSILGSNGCGKSTLIKILLRLLKPSNGIISINSNKIGYVSQRLEGINSDFPITVYEMLYAHLKALKLKDTKIIDQCLKRVAMEDYKKRLVGSLSGGQQQKIFIARALMGTPDIIILDELSTSIDIKSQSEIYKLIKNLNRTTGVTIVSIEHNLNAAIDNSTHIFQIENSKGSYLKVENFSALAYTTD